MAVNYPGVCSKHTRVFGVHRHQGCARVMNLTSMVQTLAHPVMNLTSMVHTLAYPAHVEATGVQGCMRPQLFVHGPCYFTDTPCVECPERQGCTRAQLFVHGPRFGRHAEQDDGDR